MAPSSPPWWGSRKILCTAPVAVLVSIAALDSADKALLGASFPMLEKTLGLHVDTLGYFSLFGESLWLHICLHEHCISLCPENEAHRTRITLTSTLAANLSYALFLPFWGWLVHRYTVKSAHIVLGSACCIWGVATLAIAKSQSIFSQALFRSINGAALAAILPLSQMMLADLVPQSMRGTAFGLMGFLEKAAATLATSAVVWDDDWRHPYLFVGSVSILMAFASQRYLKMKTTKIKGDGNGEDGNGEEMSLLDIFKRISRIPVFVYLVAQGVFGAIPWDMMSFILLLLEWRDFTKDQIISFQVSRDKMVHVLQYDQP